MFASGVVGLWFRCQYEGQDERRNEELEALKASWRPFDTSTNPIIFVHSSKSPVEPLESRTRLAGA